MNIDQKLSAIRDLIQQDVGNRGLARDPEENLINAFPDDFAKACASIATCSAPSIAIVTGFWIADAQSGETDGPLGTYFIAKAIASLGIPAEIVTDFFCKRPLLAAVESCNLPTQTAVLTIPPSSSGWDAFLDIDWHHVKESRKLTHLIAIERVGPSANKRCFSMRGRDITHFMCPAERLFDDALISRAPIITIGIGDGGNEIGMGKIPHETIVKNIPNGDLIHCRVPTDFLIVAGVSNWGAYALAAGVALLRGVELPAELFDPDREREILQIMVDAGPLVDGVTGKQEATVDGLSWDDYIKPLVEIGKIVRG